MSEHEYSAGDVITYRTITGSLRQVTVIARLANIEGTGYPGFDARLVTDPDSLVWGYDDQIVSVDERA